MYVSASQILLSLERLKGLHPFFGYAFLGFKKADLPVGTTTEFSYNIIRETILDAYFRPVSEFEGFFNPFKSNKTWVSTRYDSTSLQRIVADTFGDAFMHEKGSSQWGWQPDYVSELSRLMEEHQSAPIPLLDLAVWLYRDDQKVPNESEAADYLVGKFCREFGLTGEEIGALCLPQRGRAVSVAPERPDINDIFNVIGWPEGYRDEQGIILEYVTLSDVGPARDLGYFPSERLNVLTGDNSLGKTFLLDCVWWAVTGNWWRYEAEPRRSNDIGYSEIAYGIRSHSGRSLSAEAPYNRRDENWQRPLDQHEGLAIYATHSGSVALWDPIRLPNESKTLTEWRTHLVLTRDQVWEGLSREDNRGRSVQISNGLIRDWTSWQAAESEHSRLLRAFARCLRDLSPPEGPHLRPGKPARILGDSREFPTIRMPYGDVPAIYASAGVQRILALAYVIVWHWSQHVQRALRAGRAPFQRLVLLIDEIEAHLHPRWQRQILPALLGTLERLDPELQVQLHVSTHSPLVLASLEPAFDVDQDQIHHLALEGDKVDLNQIEAFKHGTVDSWLESEIFGLSSARSREAEEAIERAKALQIHKKASLKAVREAHSQLVKLLPDDDPFWVRWNYFAEKSGAIEGPARDQG